MSVATVTDLDRAKALASLGFAVLPVGMEWNDDRGCYDKIPLTERGFYSATDDLDQIARWWATYPTAVPGVWLGASGLCVLDVDDHDGTSAGAETLAMMWLPDEDLDTVHYETASGAGHHYVYRAPEGHLSTRVLGDGLEALAGGKFAVWHGPVPVDVLDIAPAPEWLAGAVRTVPGERAEYDGSVGDWIAAHAGTPDAEMAGFISRLTGREFDHIATTRTLRALVGLAAEHPGGAQALAAFEEAYLDGWEEYADEWRGMASWAVRVGGTPAPAVVTEIDPEALWTCGRAEIEHIYASARRVKKSPWALLAATLGRAAMTVPYYVQFRSDIGTRPLNLLFALSGGTGAGKTVTDDIADEMFLWAHEFGPLLEARSGEAIPSAFGFIHRKGDDEAGIKPGSLVWLHEDHAARFGFDEVGRLNAMQARQGATVLEYLKSGESGAELGGILASGLGVQIPKKEYRMVASINVQPARAHLLLSGDEVAGGFAGRMLWADVHYPPFVGLPRERRRLEQLKVRPIQWRRGDQIEALPEMEDAFDAQSDRALLPGGLDPLESHALLLRSKVAACLAVLAGRKVLNSEDWDLAGLIMEHSRRTRGVVLGAVEVAAYSARAVHGAKAEKIIEKMTRARGDGLSMSDARRGLRSDHRPIWDALVTAGEATAW